MFVPPGRGRGAQVAIHARVWVWGSSPTAYRKVEWAHSATGSDPGNWILQVKVICWDSSSSGTTFRLPGLTGAVLFQQRYLAPRGFRALGPIPARAQLCEGQDALVWAGRPRPGWSWASLYRASVSGGSGRRWEVLHRANPRAPPSCLCVLSLLPATALWATEFWGEPVSLVESQECFSSGLIRRLFCHNRNVLSLCCPLG